MTKTRRFDLGVLLTVTTGRLLTKRIGPDDNGIGQLYDLLGWMTNDSPYSHQLSRFAAECRPWLLRWFPELDAAGTPPNLARLAQLIEDATHRRQPNEGAVAMWLSWLQERGTCDCKAGYDVRRIPQDDHEKTHPYDELVAMRGTDEDVVVIRPTDEAP